MGLLEFAGSGVHVGRMLVQAVRERKEREAAGLGPGETALPDGGEAHVGEGGASNAGPSPPGMDSAVTPKQRHGPETPEPPLDGPSSRVLSPQHNVSLDTRDAELP